MRDYKRSKYSSDREPNKITAVDLAPTSSQSRASYSNMFRLVLHCCCRSTPSFQGSVASTSQPVRNVPVHHALPERHHGQSRPLDSHEFSRCVARLWPKKGVCLRSSKPAKLAHQNWVEGVTNASSEPCISNPPPSAICCQVRPPAGQHIQNWLAPLL